MNELHDNSSAGGASGRRFYGKYRGKVANNVDPFFQGRVQITCPAVLGLGRFAWAMPSSPYAGPGVGFFAPPPIGANVWVEFEGGDPDYPILGGCFWGMGEAPLPAASAPLALVKVLQTETITLSLADVPGAGGLRLEVNPPSTPLPIRMSFDVNGVTIEHGPGSITIRQAGIEIKQAATAISITPAGVEISAAPTQAKFAPAGVDIACAPATFKVSASGVQAASAPAELKISGAGVDAKNGASLMKLSASAIDLKSAKVVVNDGALEVT
jgi:Type VI secretion system/phage-baseplate injector OB domain